MARIRPKTSTNKVTKKLRPKEVRPKPSFPEIRLRREQEKKQDAHERMSKVSGLFHNNMELSKYFKQNYEQLMIS